MSNFKKNKFPILLLSALLFLGSVSAFGEDHQGKDDNDYLSTSIYRIIYQNGNGRKDTHTPENKAWVLSQLTQDPNSSVMVAKMEHFMDYEILGSPEVHKFNEALKSLPEELLKSGLKIPRKEEAQFLPVVWAIAGTYYMGFTPSLSNEGCDVQECREPDTNGHYCPVSGGDPATARDCLMKKINEFTLSARDVRLAAQVVDSGTQVTAPAASLSTGASSSSSGLSSSKELSEEAVNIEPVSPASQGSPQSAMVR